MSENSESTNLEASVLRLNFKLKKDLIVNQFNHSLDSFFTNEPILINEKTVIYIEKTGDSELYFNFDHITSRFYLRITIKRDSLFSDISATARLILDFKTSYSLAQDWKLITRTKLINHDWISKPELNIGIVKISSRGIADFVLNRLRSRIENKIDESIQEILDFRIKLNRFFRIVNSPIRIDSFMNSEINVQLDEMGLTSLYEQNEEIIGGIKITTQLRLDPIGKDQAWSRYYIIPKGIIRKEESSGISRLLLPFNISYSNLGAWLKDQYKGQRFESNDNYFIVEDVDLSKEEDKIKLNLQVTGTVNGIIELRGNPVYNIEKQELYSEGLETRLITNNIIHKAASWIMKGKIHEELERISYFPINKILENLQAIIDNHIKDIFPGDQIEGTIDIESLLVKDFDLEDEEINALLDLQFNMFTEVFDLNFFRQTDVMLSN